MAIDHSKATVDARKKEYDNTPKCDCKPAASVLSAVVGKCVVVRDACGKPCAMGTLVNADVNWIQLHNAQIICESQKIDGSENNVLANAYYPTSKYGLYECDTCDDGKKDSLMLISKQSTSIKIGK